MVYLLSSQEHAGIDHKGRAEGAGFMWTLANHRALPREDLAGRESYAQKRLTRAIVIVKLPPLLANDDYGTMGHPWRIVGALSS